MHPVGPARMELAAALPTGPWRHWTSKNALVDWDLVKDECGNHLIQSVFFYIWDPWSGWHYLVISGIANNEAIKELDASSGGQEWFERSIPQIKWNEWLQDHQDNREFGTV
jgi:hypothetical protein